MKVGIHTLGCKVNTYESEYMISLLENQGYEICDFEEICDIYIINTCTVTNTSDIKSKKIIRHARNKNKDAIIVAVGCYIQANKDNLIDDIDIAIGNKDKSKIVELIEEYIINKKKINKVINNFDLEFEDMFINKYNNRTRAFVKIQDGCENFCSYCIIPYVRGKCRSKDFNTVIKEVKDLVNNGFKEIVLTGIHTGNYGTDINTSFKDLLKELIKIDGLKRLRISSIEITELNDDVLDIIKNNDIIVNHLHIPIQAASDNVLEKMNRKYNLDYFIKKIDKIKQIKDDISITTDIIVGHPYETDSDFESGIEVLKRIGFTKLHVFPYSRRKGTKADLMPQVNDLIKKQRARTLLELSKDLEIEYMKKHLNKEMEILVEKTNNEYSIGHTTNYIQVKVNKKLNNGELVKVKIKEINYPYCIGEEV